MPKQNCCRPAPEPIWKSYRARCLCAVSFGLGMAVSSFCPPSLALFICAVILAALGISLLRH